MARRVLAIALGEIIFKAELGKVESGLQNNWLTDIGINLE